MKIRKTWETSDGIRAAEVEELGTCVDGRDLAKWLLTIDPSKSKSPTARAALERFQREVPALNPAAQYRRAVAMLNELGAQVPPELQSLKISVAAEKAG